MKNLTLAFRACKNLSLSLLRRGMSALVQASFPPRENLTTKDENTSFTLGGETPPLLLNSELRTPNSELTIFKLAPHGTIPQPSMKILCD